MLGNGLAYEVFTEFDTGKMATPESLYLLWLWIGSAFLVKSSKIEPGQLLLIYVPGLSRFPTATKISIAPVARLACLP